MTDASREDADLVRSLRAGERPAYEQLVERHGGAMLAVARRFLRTEADAEDAVQDALVSVVRSIRAFDGNARLGTWLHRVVVNASLMRLRSMSRRPTTPLVPGEHESCERVSGRRGAPDGIESASRAEIVAGVRECVSRLPDDVGCALRLRDIEGWDMRSICDVLDISLTTLKGRLLRGRTLLRAMIEGRLGEVRG